MSAFLKAQDSGWYSEFLNPVVEAILEDESNVHILDIGTGPGKLPEMLIQKNSNLRITGIDINPAMIEIARQKVNHKNVSFEVQTANEPLAFKNNSFDAITFCSVLFLLDNETRMFLMHEALRVLKPTGKIVVLTPSGKTSILNAVGEIKSFAPSKHNWTFLVWKSLTSQRGRKWQVEQWLEQYSISNQSKYAKTLVFNDNASIEKIYKTKE